MMPFELFINNLSQKLSGPLPGAKAHERLSPASRKNYPDDPDLAKAKPSSVLALFYPENGCARLIFIQRPVYNGVHSGQIAFPGGGYEDFDKDDRATALRETREEIGVAPEKIHVIGKLSDLYIPPSNFLVHPYVGYMNQVPHYNPDPEEVKEVFSLRVTDLLNEESFQYREVNGRNYRFEAPCYFVDNRLIWGATSMMLSELLEVIRSIK